MNVNPMPARWRARFPSLGARLVGLFLVLAFAVGVTFMLGLHVLQRVDWREYLHPLVLNYSDTAAWPRSARRRTSIARDCSRSGCRCTSASRVREVNWDSADEPPPPPPAGQRHAARLSRRSMVTLPNGDPLPLIVPGPPRAAPRRRRRSAAAAARRAAGTRTVRATWKLDPSDWAHRAPRAGRPSHHLRPGRHVARATRGAHRLGHAGRAAAADGAGLRGVRHMLHPLVALRAGAVRYGQGDFSQPIVPRNRDELGDLAEQINAMAARLHHMLDAKRQLLLAISHELRSPLARARMNAELIDESGERSALLRDLGEMRDLITDLLESERLADVQAGGHAALQTEAGDAVGHHPRAVRRAGRPPARSSLQLDETLPALPLDRARMRLLLRNLVDNALRHGSEAGRRRWSPPSGTPQHGATGGARLRPRHGGEPAATRQRGLLPRRCRRACAAPAASAWACTCASWWPRPTAAR
jgi:hypothetical protein